MKSCVLILLAALPFFSFICVCDEVLSGLDLLASVANILPPDTLETISPLNSTDQESAHDLVQSLLGQPEFPESTLKELRARYSDKKVYFSFILHILGMREFEALPIAIKVSVYYEFDLITRQLPGLTNLADFSTLNPVIYTALGLSASNLGNLSILKRLVETNLFDLNAEYELGSFKGNAIVFLSRHAQCLDFAIANGLDLSWGVKSFSGARINVFSFVRIYGTPEAYAVVSKHDVSLSGKKRSSASSSSSNDSKATKIYTPAASEHDAATCQNPSAFKTSVTSEQSENFENSFIYRYLKEHNGHKKTLMGLSNIPGEIKRLLIVYGLPALRKLLTERPIYLERPDLLPMFREVLRDNVVEIAGIYAIDASRCVELFTLVRNQYQNDLIFAQFLFEFYKCSPMSAKDYIIHMHFLDSDTFNFALEMQDYSSLPEGWLRALGFYAVILDSPLILTKVVQTNVSALGEGFVVDRKLTYIYCPVNSARILRILLSFKVPMRNHAIIRGDPVPIIYHLLKLNDPEITAIVKEFDWMPRSISDSLEYAQYWNDASNIAILSELKDLITA
jgi:hypothetical protein